MACTFCATGTQGLARNLSAGEIVSQLLTLQSLCERRVTHAVFMGMGEPLLNLANTLQAIHILNDEIGIAMRHITVSTVGILPAIDKLAERKLQITLAVSLHAPTDALRAQLVPVHRTYDLKQLMQTCRRYFENTGRRVTFEYVLLRGVNDNAKEAYELAHLLGSMPCAVNLIPYNPTTVSQTYQRPQAGRIRQFRRILELSGITVTQRKERGQLIGAACGQLVTERYGAARKVRPAPLYAEPPALWPAAPPTASVLRQ
jgi:23S rRNA (adenine2503-C2)-methyltransferase